MKRKELWHLCYIKKFDLKTERGKFLHYTNLCPRWNYECNHSNDPHYDELKPIAQLLANSIKN